MALLSAQAFLPPPGAALGTTLGVSCQLCKGSHSHGSLIPHPQQAHTPPPPPSSLPLLASLITLFSWRSHNHSPSPCTCLSRADPSHGQVEWPPKDPVLGHSTSEGILLIFPVCSLSLNSGRLSYSMGSRGKQGEEEGEDGGGGSESRPTTGAGGKQRRVAWTSAQGPGPAREGLMAHEPLPPHCAATSLC